MKKLTTNPQTLVLISMLFCSFGLMAKVQAVSPAPDGGYPGGNTAEGQSALFSLTTGTYNTAVGFLSLRNSTEGQFNTAVGAGALLSNNTTGFQHTPDGVAVSSQNTAVGAGALLSNTTGCKNAANGTFALFSNTTGIGNAASGNFALQNNTTGSFNTANGMSALIGNTSGLGNTALGQGAGAALTTEDRNIDIGNTGVVGDSGTIRIGDNVVHHITYIAGISGGNAIGGNAVFVTSDGRLGTVTSSARFKEEVKPMDKASEVLLALEPVTFRYKKELDPSGTRQVGLVAEDVEKADPDLVVHDKDGKPYSVRYEQVNAMLLNEFLKEHRKVEELEATVLRREKSFQSRLAEQEQQIQALALGLQKVSAGLEMSKPVSQVVVNTD